MEDFGSHINLSMFVTIFNVVSILGAISSLVTTKVLRRKTLLLLGYFLVCVIQALLSGLYLVERENENSIPELAYLIASLHCLTWFSNSALGVSGLAVLKTEIFPPTLKEFFNSLMAFTGDATGFAAVKTYTFLVDVIGTEWVLALYAFLNLISVFIIIIGVQDTKDKTLYEIQNELHNPSHKGQ